MCVWCSTFVLKNSLQPRHKYGLLCPCIEDMCFLRCGNWLNAVPVSVHKRHLNGFSPVCFRMCNLRTLECANACQHTWQRYGRSPEWILWCTTNCDRCVNVVPQSAHPWGFNLLWIRMCCGKCPLNILLQTGQWNAFTFSWKHAKCLFSASGRRKLWKESRSKKATFTKLTNRKQNLSYLSTLVTRVIPFVLVWLQVEL